MSRSTGVGSETGCTGFLARTTIEPGTEARLDETGSIVVRRPSLEWNLNAGARTSIRVDLSRPAVPVVRISFYRSSSYIDMPGGSTH